MGWLKPCDLWLFIECYSRYCMCLKELKLKGDGKGSV